MLGNSFVMQYVITGTLVKHEVDYKWSECVCYGTFSAQSPRLTWLSMAAKSWYGFVPANMKLGVCGWLGYRDDLAPSKLTSFGGLRCLVT